MLNKALSDRYVVTRSLTEGGGSRLFAARDDRLGREVVVKIPNGGGPSAIAAEASALLRLQHPNNIRLLDYGEAPVSGGVLAYIVLEHFEAPTLRSILTEFRRLAPLDAVEVARQVLQALDEAHRHGLTHGDVKPENILVARQGATVGHVKVIDYGVTERMGTPQYMAPELRSGQPRSATTDLYAVGATLYECLAGCRANGHGSLTLTDLVPTSPAVAEVVHRAMRPHPDERYASAIEMLAALDAIAPEHLDAYDLGAFACRQSQEHLPTLEFVPELAAETVSGPVETTHAVAVPLRSSQRPSLWFLAGDPALDQPALRGLIRVLASRYEVEVLDEDERFLRRWRGPQAGRAAFEPPWVVVFGGHHVATEDPLLALLRDDSDAARALVMSGPDLDLVRATVDWCGLDHVASLPSTEEALLGGFESLIDRRRHLHQHYDCLRLALRDAREDRSRIERRREIDS